jgi:hypothetical protein
MGEQMELKKEEIDTGVLWTGIANGETAKWFCENGTVPKIKAVANEYWVGVELVDEEGMILSCSVRANH